MNNPWPDCNRCGMPNGCPDNMWDAITYTVARFPFYDCGDLIFRYLFIHAAPDLALELIVI